MSAVPPPSVVSPNSPAAHNKLLFCSPEPRSTGSIIVFIRGHASVPIPPVRDECAQMRFSRSALKLITRCSCQLPCSPHKAHLISFLQAKVFDVLVPVWKKKEGEKERKVAYFQLAFRSGIAIFDLMLD